ncbi:MAG: hypothetical protein EPO46_09390 [Lysobacter sp.]|nr:MAG: hypothetical protein EPO46_09390 [Lysobacter sp.]
MQFFLLGMISMGSLVVALLFLRFWRTSGDRLFLFFAAAFAMEAVNRALFAYGGAQDEDTLFYFVARLLAYGLILFAVVDKNLRQKRLRGEAPSRRG